MLKVFQQWSQKLQYLQYYFWHFATAWTILDADVISDHQQRSQVKLYLPFHEVGLQYFLFSRNFCYLFWWVLRNLKLFHLEHSHMVVTTCNQLYCEDLCTSCHHRYFLPFSPELKSWMQVSLMACFRHSAILAIIRGDPVPSFRILLSVKANIYSRHESLNYE